MKHKVTFENTSVGDIFICVRVANSVELYAEYTVTTVYLEAFILDKNFYYPFDGQDLSKTYASLFIHKKLLSETELFLFKLSGRLTHDKISK